MRVLYTNGNGLLNKRHDLQVLLQSIQEQPDIIAINEFKPKNFSHKLLPGEFNLDGYNCFTNGLLWTIIKKEGCYFILRQILK